MAFRPNKLIEVNSAIGSKATVDFAISTYQMDANDIQFSFRYGNFTSSSSGTGNVGGVNSLRYRWTASKNTTSLGYTEVVVVSSKTNKIRPVVIEIHVTPTGSGSETVVSDNKISYYSDGSSTVAFPQIGIISDKWDGEKLKVGTRASLRPDSVDSRLNITVNSETTVEGRGDLVSNDVNITIPGDTLLWKGELHYKKTYHQPGKILLDITKYKFQDMVADVYIPYGMEPIGGSVKAVSLEGEKGEITAKIYGGKATCPVAFDFINDIQEVKVYPIYDSENENLDVNKPPIFTITINSDPWSETLQPNSTTDKQNSDTIEASWDPTTKELTFKFIAEAGGVKGYKYEFVQVVGNNNHKRFIIPNIEMYHNFNTDYVRPDNTPDPNDVSDFQPSITIHDGLMKELVLGPSKVLLKADTHVEDVLPIEADDIDAMGNLVELNLDFTQQQLQAALGISSGGSANNKRPELTDSEFFSKFETKILSFTGESNTTIAKVAKP